MTPLPPAVVTALAQQAAESPAHLDPVLVQQVCQEWAELTAMLDDREAEDGPALKKMLTDTVAQWRMKQRAEQAESDLRAVREIHRIEVGVLRDERDKALDMVAEIGKPLAALSMPQIHRNADVVKALRQREIDAKETIKRLGEGIMQCIAASWSGTRSLDWTHPELILAEYVGHLRAERAAADEALAACQSQGYAAVANLYTLCRRMVRQKTDMQRDVLMCHATRIASQAGIPTGVMALLRDATPTDVPALVAQRDAALAERDALKATNERLTFALAEAQLVANSSWRCFKCGMVLTDEAAARNHFGDEKCVSELRRLSNDMRALCNRQSAALTEARRVLREVDRD